MNNKLGFLCLSIVVEEGQLYRTEDGGKSYKKVNFPETKVALDGGKTIILLIYLECLMRKVEISMFWLDKDLMGI
ncbi:hypothetical protein ACI7YW_08895 [Clostridium ljungdahlii]|uniref:hypothetical protein n=1 Tax=Clostridium ljungdahlii TaxID=1538 RepID=UPI003869F443